MKISFNWLKEYIQFDLSPEETAGYLTDCGLEIEGIEEYESVKGGLRGLVIGEVLSCTPHPDSDHLHLTVVNIGADTSLHIVCGAANVAKGQKVVVATIGTVLYKGDESFAIKKTKIRGAISEGMICAEDEIGLGISHEGIMILDSSAIPGTPAAEYFQVEKDYVLEIGLTPNRSDAISHFGVARDLYAVLNTKKIPSSTLLFPKAEDFIPSAKTNPIDITIENKKACPRYTGLCFENVTVKESPAWLKNRLQAIGIRPINNIVDITQYIMFEMGQPLHAFDADFITGNKVIIKNLPDGTSFRTLDGNELKLSSEDLMICNEKEGMCIAGVYGGLHFGVTDKTRNVFLESAYFDPLTVRKTSKRHHLKTDAAFRYERGADPEVTVHAIRRAANLIQELSGATIVSEIIDVYPTKLEPRKIKLSFEEVNKVIGKEIPKDMVTSILLLLGMEVENIGEDKLMVIVPLNRADVTRSIDLIEEILRIYGYNNVEIPSTIHYQYTTERNTMSSKWRKVISNYLVDNGYYEVINNPLTKGNYADSFNFIKEEETVRLLSPLSKELDVMRQTLLFSGLETIVRNLNNKNPNIRIFEFGNIYGKVQDCATEDVAARFVERSMLSILLTGKNGDEQWNKVAQELDFFELKNQLNNILLKLNYPVQTLVLAQGTNHMFMQELSYMHGEQVLIRVGQVHPKVLKEFNIKKSVYYAEVDLLTLYANAGKNSVEYEAILSYPMVKRDLALVIDKNITYLELENIAKKCGSKWLKSVSLFDVYEGDKIEKGKKSYALNFVLQHSEKTLTDEEINKVMNKLVSAFQREVGAKLR